MAQKKAKAKKRGFRGLINISGIRASIRKEKAKEAKKAAKIQAINRQIPIYDMLSKHPNVRIAVPQKNKFMKFFPASVGLTGVYTPAHWRYGKPFNNIYLNIIFYGLNDENIGTSIVGTMYVIKKTLADKREFIMLDVINTGGVSSHEFRIQNSDGKGIPILGTNKEIFFRPKKKVVRMYIVASATA